MTPGRGGHVGLATRIMRTTLVIGVVTVFTAGVVGLVNTTRLSSRQSAGRDLMTTQLVQDKVTSRLDVAVGEMRRIGEAIRAEPIDVGDASRLQSLVGIDSPVFERVVLVDAKGDLIASSEGSSTVHSMKSLTAYKAAVQGERGPLTILPRNGGWQLWTVWAPEGSESFYLLGELKTGFVTAALEHAAGDHRRVLLVDRGVVLASAGDGARPELRGARWSADSENSGRVVLSPNDGSSMQGMYVELSGAEPLNWRLVVLSPPGLTLLQAWDTVLPSVVILFIGGFVGLIAAWSVSTRLVRPLRELERAARVAASGAFVRPIHVHGNDEIGRVAEAFNQVSLRLNSLHDLSQLLASAGQVDQVLDGVLSAMRHLVGPGVVAIYLYDQASGQLVPAKLSGVQEAQPAPVDMREDGWLAQVLLSPEPLTLSDPDQIAAQLPGLAAQRGHALGVPLVAGSEPLGVVVALRDEDRPLSDAEREMVRTFSAQAAVAVHTSRLFQFESQSRRVAEALRAVAEELVRPEGLERALRRIESVIAELFDASAAAIVVVDRGAVALAGSASGDDSAILAVGLRALKAESTDSMPVLVRRGADARSDELLARLGGEVLLVVPVALDTDHGAVMVIAGDRSLESAEWSRVAGAVADELALAFDNAYFYERALTRAANLETIFRISQAVGSSLQINVVLNRVLDVVQKILSADAVVLMEYDPRRKALSTAMARGDVPRSMLTVEIRPGEDLPGHVFTSGQPATLRELHAGMQGLAGDAAANDLRSLLAVPLLARGRSIGVLMVFSMDAGAFTEEDASVLQTFATQAALAIDTARLYGREHEVASVLQRSILPDELPDFEEVEAGSVYAPAGTEAEIGGDYYDLFRVPCGDIWFAIADVCGKGVHAATKTSMIKYALRALAAAGLSPARVLTELNRMVAESGEPSDIVTVWIGRLDRDATRLTWANGGHPPGILRHPDGSEVTLDVTGPLLGAIAEVPYDEMEVPVGARDRVLLYTDGVTEARSGNIFFGEQRVREAFTGDGSANDAARGLLDAVRRFSRADLRDDVAVLVVSVR